MDEKLDKLDIQYVCEGCVCKNKIKKIFRNPPQLKKTASEFIS